MNTAEINETALNAMTEAELEAAFELTKPYAFDDSVYSLIFLAVGLRLLDFEINDFSHSLV